MRLVCACASVVLLPFRSVAALLLFVLLLLLLLLLVDQPPLPLLISDRNRSVAANN
jgi:hypothetical protein